MICNLMWASDDGLGFNLAVPKRRVWNLFMNHLVFPTSATCGTASALIHKLIAANRAGCNTLQLVCPMCTVLLPRGMPRWRMCFPMP
jgi:hypothetical protein